MSSLFCECGAKLKHRDYVKRIVKCGDGLVMWTKVERMICPCCHTIKRILPDNLVPYKHYSKDIIFAVRNGLVTSDTIGFEDYPCEMTMKRWRES